jgi:hypothetical protein
MLAFLLSVSSVFMDEHTVSPPKAATTHLEGVQVRPQRRSGVSLFRVIAKDERFLRDAWKVEART